MISLVIPAHNEEALLPRTLEALFPAARETGEPFEVIVVDDASTDCTAVIARERGARVVAIDRRQIAAARNAGAREAKGEVLAFVDADTVVNGRTLRAMVEAIRGGAAGGGARIDFDRAPLYISLALKVFTFFYHLLGLAGGCFIFARREAFASAGGFDEKYFAGEEVLLSRALRNEGRFVILRQRVITSGRKARPGYLLRLLLLSLRILIRGPGALRRREGLDIWYGERTDQAPVKNPPPGPGSPSGSRSRAC